MEEANFLCEIGTEEIPAGYLHDAITILGKEFPSKLEENRLAYDTVRVMATPRRLAILVSGLADSQRGEEVEIKGPSVRVGYDAEGRPTKALEGFLKGNGVSLSSVYPVKTDKGEYLYARKKLDARKTEEIIPQIIEHFVRTLPFPKKMRWSSSKISFPRPIAYFLLLLNGRVIPFELDGISSSNRTRGHYIQHNHTVEVQKASDYELVLEQNGVIADQEKRKKVILAELTSAAAKLNAQLIYDDELLETVTFLTESPYVVTCSFGREFLKIPDIVLITEMKEHQKYFAVKGADGKLLPSFLVVSNNPETPHVRAGNERVIKARFNDARFFYDDDRKTPLHEKVESLKSVLFHKELGTIYQKVERMQHIAGVISGLLGLDTGTRKKIGRAVLLSKVDLNTAMVFEFTSLQGRIGRIYALLDGEDPEVADAIDEHYRPRYQGDPLPTGMVSIVVSLAEKIDNLVGSYSVGNIPKGSQDPYALRRQANAMVEMLIAAEINLDLREVLEACAGRYREGAALTPKILEFITARANTIFAERGLRYDEIDACLSIDSHDYLELYRRAKSINEFRKTEGFTQMLLSFKRMNNIVSAFDAKNPGYRPAFDGAKLVEKTEIDLYGFFNDRRDRIAGLIASNRYIELFSLLIEGKAIIDSFFDAVMVMVDDVRLRDNRLAMLTIILTPFKNLLDFSRISE